MVPSRAEGRGLAFEVGRRHPRGKQFREAEAGEEQGPTDLISFGQGPSQLSRCETCICCVSGKICGARVCV